MSSDYEKWMDAFMSAEDDDPLTDLDAKHIAEAFKKLISGINESTVIIKRLAEVLSAEPFEQSAFIEARELFQSLDEMDTIYLPDDLYFMANRIQNAP